MAQDKSTSPDPAERTAAMQLGRASMWVSIAGLVVAGIVGVIFVILRIVIAASYDTYN